MLSPFLLIIFTDRVSRLYPFVMSKLSWFEEDTKKQKGGKY